MAICFLREKSKTTISGRALLKVGIKPAVNTARIALKDLCLVFRTQCRKGVDIAAGVVEVIAGLRVDTADRADHFRGKQNVLDGDDLRQKLDAGAVIDAGIEEDILEQKVRQRRQLHVLREPPVAAPVIGNGAAAVRNDELQGWKPLEQIGGQELHERGRVAVQIVRASPVEAGIAG